MGKRLKYSADISHVRIMSSLIFFVDNFHLKSPSMDAYESGRDVWDEVALKNFLPVDEINLFHSWKACLQNNANFSDVLSQIPSPSYPSCLPALCFCAAIRSCDEAWPKIEVLSAYTKLWQTLPEAVKSSSDTIAASFVSRLQEVFFGYIKSPLLLFKTSDSPALINPITEQSISHKELSTFVRAFRIPYRSSKLSPSKLRVALALPNGFLLGLACLAVSSYHTAAPINITGGMRQFRSDLELIQPEVVLVLEHDIPKLGLDQDWVLKTGLVVLTVETNTLMTFTIPPPSNQIHRSVDECCPNKSTDTAFLLLTSGTSGTKKLVPVSTLSLLIGISCVIRSWGLSPDDSCINMMPLNHVGGIVRNLFAPIFSGGSTILCPSFDPNLFWDLVQSNQGTWYYASPSMHASILAEEEFRDYNHSQSKIRLVCNAAGALLPALALKLQNTFCCTILPSYGMTECMPISTPPLDYALGRPGTSGISCGPEIAIMDDENKSLSSGEIGRVCVRGGGTFAGYLEEGQISKNTLTRNGWFDTGDLGYLDGDSYLYLTGRGKEVINRGGEIISPFEVEEAIITASQSTSSAIYKRVKEVLAFSAPHEALQEVVGVVIVPDSRRPRPDIRMLHSALNDVIHASKIPFVIVYMDALPMYNNKVIRIKLGERMDLEPLRDNSKLPQRHFSAICPPANSSLESRIVTIPCKIDAQLIKESINQIFSSEFDLHVGIQPQSGLSEVIIAPKDNQKLSSDLKMKVNEHLCSNVDGYQVPADILIIDFPIPRINSTTVDEVELNSIINRCKTEKANTNGASATQVKIIAAMAEVLSIPNHVIGPGSDFFQIGGDSLSAGRLLSTLRRDFNIRIPIHQLFVMSTVRDLSTLANEIDLTSAIKSDETPTSEVDHEPIKMCSSTNPMVLIIQLLPIIFFYPVKMAFWFTMFIYSLSIISDYWRESNLLAQLLTLLVALSLSRLSTQIASPVFGIILKWVIIGRYKAGTYPMWGKYHTRWWIVDKILMIYGKGVFRYSHVSRLFYYRALGARIGRGVTIERGTNIGEYDLLDIDDDVYLDRCTCRPFACEKNTTMFLGKIKLGRNSSVGLKSYVAAGSTLPADTFIGPNSSSYEINDAEDDNRGNTNGKVPEPHILLKILAIYPVQLMVLFISAVPWIMAIIGMVDSKPSGNSHNGVLTIIKWLASPRRIAFHYLAVLFHQILNPIVRFLSVVCVKLTLDKFCGKTTGSKISNLSTLQIFRIGMLDALNPSQALQSVVKLFGNHYELTSISARALGAKVGKRVYWPGRGPSVQDYDLLEIGDDVVFGSRSYLLTRDGISLASIKIGAGSMIADRVVINPGTVIGYRAVLGSGTTTRRRQLCAPETVWIGKKNGNAICLSQDKMTGPTQSLEFKEAFAFPDEEDQPYRKETNTSDMVGSETTVQPNEKIISNEISQKELKAESYDPSLGYEYPKELDGKTISPFGRAFYAHQAPYHVLTLPTIFLYSALSIFLTRALWNISTTVNLVLYFLAKSTDLLWRRPSRSLIIYGLNVCLMSTFMIFVTISAIVIVVAAKWIVIGRRQPGNYDWDKSSYCQRWQLFLTIEGFRSRCLGGNGVLNLFTGTYYIVLYYRLLGARIGNNTALFAGGCPSAFITEPDLLVIGNRVAIDDASLVAHINSRGTFDLRTLEIADGAVLRSGSRLLSGASMGRNSRLLEHTLIMAGDRADEGLTYQGWPAEVYISNGVA
ncbi:unnamed protein product [Blumeria hordei]|uniref:Carrier domain-containing protein n=1 Tax=Blumeria hordei TaxID=2867405 RepID=A0A383UJF3_BLUHO|nr:unnamed protein product [Blumeria hordei]